MTDKEILKLAFTKAYKNGWGHDPKHYFDCMILHANRSENTGPNWTHRQYCLAEIFRHEFAKAFWGEISKEQIEKLKGSFYFIYDWKYHLQQMVLEENPLKYLEKFI